MATIQTSFETALKKGDLAEKAIKGILEKRGYVVYMPKTEGSHAFDMLAIKNKETAIALDIKAKARRTKYKDTGIDVRLYNVYKNFSVKHNMPFWVIFVDESMKKAYGNELSVLDQERVLDGHKYPWECITQEGRRIVYWHIDSMITIADLEESLVNDLIVTSQRNYEYPKEN
jgi:hypothetical protein